jgi:hypothetical protein
MTTPAAGEGTTEGQETQGPDFSPVIDRVEQLETSFAPVIEWAQSQMQTPEEEGESYDDFVNRLFAGDEEAQAQAEQAPEVPAVFRDPQTFNQLLDRAVEERLAQTVGPELEAGRQDRFERQVADLVDRFPALADQETAGEIVLAAQQLAQELGQPELWRSPKIIELTFLAEQARQRSDAEVPADASGEVRLEAGSGGNPGQQEPGLADQLIQAHRGSTSIFR